MSGLNALPWNAVWLLWLAACRHGDQRGCFVEWVEARICVLHFVLQLLVGAVTLSWSSGMRCVPLGGMGTIGSLVGTLALVSGTTNKEGPFTQKNLYI